MINQTLRDLQSAASRNRVDGHERDHFNRAMSELQQMSYRSQGQIDGGRLNRVVEDLDHLSRADQIHPRDRQVLARDRQALQSLYYNRRRIQRLVIGFRWYRDYVAHRAYIGTSGWNYKHWRNLIYPPKFAQKNWLGFIAEQFDTVEVNTSFYRIPAS